MKKNLFIKRLSAIILLVPLLFLFQVVLENTNIIDRDQVGATVGAGSWRAGQIIDDNVFYNSNDMTVDQIQAFLNSKNPNCDTWGTQQSELGGGTRAQYGASRGYPAPFICLKDYYENPTTHANNLSGRPIPAGGMNAAQLIKNAADTWGVSNRVLLVMIQKESPGPLITDAWPFPNQYRNAMGYGCPDTAPCDPQYEGFYNQINNAARQFIIYKNNPNNYRHKSGQNNAVLYNPQASCGSSSVYIQGKATAGLYNYTPYQPNQAALNNMYGTGDSCSAYGNRNFWRLFNDWFGSTLGLARDASIESTTNTNQWLEYGDSGTVTVMARNTGADGWCGDGSCPAGQLPTRLVAQNYTPFGMYDSSDPSWASNAQVKMQTAYVAPGEIGTFTFRIKSPYITNYDVSSRFYVLVGSTTFAQNANVWIGGHTFPTPMQLVSKTVDSSVILPNQKATATVTIRNLSKVAWYSDTGKGPGNLPMRLFIPGYTASPYYDASDPAWVSPSQVAMKTPVVNPGEDAVFEFSLRGAFKENRDSLKFLPVINGHVQYADLGITYAISTPQPQLSYQYVNSTPPPATMLRGTTASQKTTIVLKNTGNTIWRNESSGAYNRVRLVTIFPRYHSHPFYDSTDPAWLSSAQVAMKTPVVNPGEDAVFEFNWKAPGTPGNYLEYFSLVMDGAGFFPEYGSALRTIVQ